MMIPMYIDMHFHQINYLMFIIATPVFIYLSSSIFKAAFISLKNHQLTMDVMYSMGIGIAYISSVLGTFGILLDKNFIFYESAILLSTFLTLGRYLESRARGKTSEAIKKLISLQPKTASVIRNETELEISVDDILINDKVIVKPGGKFPVDGIVIEGQSFVDESAITGESMPVFKKANDAIIGGTINQSSVIIFSAQKIGKETMLSQIIKLVEEAQGSKPPMQKISDKIVSWFIPMILILAIATFIVWFIGMRESLEFSISRLISILVIACPCALGLATPTAITVGIGRGAELGILIKNSEVIEKANLISTVIFDKTGTLTEGRPTLTDIIPIDIDEKQLLIFTASVEKNSNHPISQAILNKAEKDGLTILKSTGYGLFEGKGIYAFIDGKEIIIGSRNLFLSQKITISEEYKNIIDKFEKDGKTVFLIAIDKTLRGIMAVTDTIKKGSEQAILLLQRMGIKTIMITGDNKQSATSLGKQLGLNNILAEVLPSDKAAEVKKIQERGEVVAFVGDGVNDAPALVQADVGIAIGSGTDVAIESGEIVLIRNNVLDVAIAIELCKKIFSRIKWNLFWAFAYNVVLIPFAAGVFYPIYKITMKPELAGLAMAFSSITVVTFSLMLKKWNPNIN